MSYLSSINKIPELIAPPIALLVATLFVFGGGIFSTLIWLISIAPHELGHSYLNWLSGVFAVPSFGMTVQFSDGFSFIFSIFFLSVLGAVFYYSRKASYLFWMVFSAISIFGFFSFLILSEATKEMVMIWGGVAGEFFFSSLSIIAFHYPMPKRFAWQNNRYLFLALGAVVFLSSTLTWARARADFSKLPMGALFDFSAITTGESGGDLDRLMRDFGWSSAEVVSSYLTLSLLCASFLFLHYLWVCWQCLSRIEKPA